MTGTDRIAAVATCYRGLRAHCDECERCEAIGSRLRVVAGSCGREVMRSLYGSLCESGAALAWEWDQAVSEAIEASPVRAVAVRLGVWDDSDPDRTDRVAALMSAPPDAFARLALMGDDERRKAEIAAVLRGYSGPRRPGTEQAGTGHWGDQSGAVSDVVRRCMECGQPCAPDHELCYRCYRHAK